MVANNTRVPVFVVKKRQKKGVDATKEVAVRREAALERDNLEQVGTFD